MENQDVFKGVTPTQGEVISYWLSQQDADGRVKRSKINPGALGTALASISVIQVEPGGITRFRVVGSRVRHLFGKDVAGMPVHEVLGARGAIYASGLNQTLKTCSPLGGVNVIGARFHTWLRLPLVGARGQLTQVLCHDELLTSRRELLPPYGTASPFQQSSPQVAA